MNSRWHNLKNRNDKEFQRATGVKRPVFDKMVNEIVESERIKYSAGGKPPKLIAEEKVLMMLHYYREYPTFFHLGIIYGVSESTAWRHVTSTEAVLIKSKEFSLPGKKQCIKSNYKFVIVDVTESPIERPKKK